MSSAVVVDTSAAIAVLWHEPSEAALLAALDEADRRVMSAATVVELGIVLRGRVRRPMSSGVLERFLVAGRIDVVPVDHELAIRALEGFERFGKGRHAAALNLGDCFTYGLSKHENAPILCVGDDFARTDVEVVALD